MQTKLVHKSESNNSNQSVNMNHCHHHLILINASVKMFLKGDGLSSGEVMDHVKIQSEETDTRVEVKIFH